jgi:phage gp36-like protein
MPPVVAPQPYCSAIDVSDYLSVEGTQLRLDDDNTASGQWLYCQQTAVLGATTIICQPLPCTMPAGNTLDWGGADMPAVVEAVLSAMALAGATSLQVFPLPGQVNQGAMAVDGGVNAYELARINKAINYASSRVNDYVLPRYQNPALLQTSWTVNRWATILACKWLATRRTQGCPGSLEEDYKEAQAEMQKVAVGQMQIGDIGTPVAEWPAWSNVKVDARYWIKKLRVERTISETASGGPTGYAQTIDWTAESVAEY